MKKTVTFEFTKRLYIEIDFEHLDDLHPGVIDGDGELDRYFVNDVLGDIVEEIGPDIADQPWATVKAVDEDWDFRVSV